MKRLNFAGMAILFCLLISPFLVNAKGANVEKVVVSIELRLDNGDTFNLIGDGTKVTTPSSNYLKTYKYEVPEDVLEQIDFGIFANKLLGVVLELDSGEIVVGLGFLNKAGILNITAHQNGAGRYFPRGWF